MMSATSLRILKYFVYALSVAWMLASAWHFFNPDQPPDLAQQAYDRMIEQRMNDCQGNFGERYECRSALIRQQKVQLFYWWAERVSIITVPAFVILTFLYFYLKFEARKTEQKRVAARLDRMDKKAMEARQRAIEEGRRRAELARLKAEAKRREKQHIKHILVMDKDPAQTEPLVSMLSRLGHEVGIADSIQIALTNFKESGYDLVMIDIFQENMGGIPAIQELRATEVSFKAIAMSESFGKLSDNDIERVRVKLGVDRVLRKPLDLENLTFVLQEILAAEEETPAAASDESAPETQPARSA
jgi:CheY-like chemotaxis protein